MKDPAACIFSWPESSQNLSMSGNVRECEDHNSFLRPGASSVASTNPEEGLIMPSVTSSNLGQPPPSSAVETSAIPSLISGHCNSPPLSDFSHSPGLLCISGSGSDACILRWPSNAASASFANRRNYLRLRGGKQFINHQDCCCVRPGVWSQDVTSQRGSQGLHCCEFYLTVILLKVANFENIEREDQYYRSWISHSFQLALPFSLAFNESAYPLIINIIIILLFS